MNEKEGWKAKWKGPGPDGARGYTPSRGLRTVLGGENIDMMNKGEGAMSPDEMRTYIMNAPPVRLGITKWTDDDYDNAARRHAKEILIWAEQNRDQFLKYGLPRDFPVFEEGLTGFQGGWAINAVRYAMESDSSIHNPAIVTIDVSDRR